MRAFTPRLPYHVVWIATNACNARCIHCSSNAAKAYCDELTTSDAMRMFDEFASLGIFDVAISGGEPLVRADVIGLVEYATDLGIRVGIGSNGSTINQDVIRRLKTARLDRLQISIDGLPETHDEARRWHGLHEKSRNAIRAAVEADIKVHVCCTVHRMNIGELPAIIDKAATWGTAHFNLSRFVPTGRGTTTLDLTPMEWKSVVEIYDKKRVEYRDVMSFSTHLSQLILSDPSLDCVAGFAGCQAGLGQACIGARGEVTPCVMLPLVVGNIRDESFERIWEHALQLRSIRDRAQLKGACATCSVRAKCGGCRGVAFAYTGDYLAADPRCWRVA
jgi:radical SAM protein with 4Fe4S-binding SPASM domain